MPQSLAQNYVHLIFSTKDRYPFLSAAVCERLYPYIAKACQGENSPAIKVGGVADHLHLLFRVSKNHALATVIGSIKGESSKWLKGTFPEMSRFAWQGGYGAFSVSASQIDDVTAYIANQEEHHRTKTFKEEFRAFLTKYGAEFDERYVWD